MKEPRQARGKGRVTKGGADPAAKSLGKRGGLARAQVLPAQRRTEIARNAAEERWKR